MNEFSPSRSKPMLLGIVIAASQLVACGGGSGGEPASTSTAAVVPSSQTAAAPTAAASAAEAPASAVTLASQEAAQTTAPASAPASQAPTTEAAPAITAQSSSVIGEPAPGVATSSTAPSPTLAPTAQATAEATALVTAAVPTSAQAQTTSAATSPTANTTPTQTAQATAQGATQATTTNTTPPARCTVGETRTFGACRAFASIGISHGETVSFWNTNANVTGTIAASCNNGVVTWHPGKCSDTTVPLAMQVSTQIKTSPVVEQANVSPPPLASLQTFVATPPYAVMTIKGLKAVPLIPYGGKNEVPRTHDFVSAFVNPANQRPNAFTVQTPIQTNGALQYLNLHEASTPALNALGSPGRASIESGTLKLAYLPNDPVSSEKLRTQVNSYPIPTQRTLTWDLSFKFGGDKAGEAWPTVKYTTSPVLIWQVIQNTRGFPPMVLLVDTDPADSNKLMLILAWRGTNTLNYTNRWTVAGLNKNQYYDLTIQANLDEREGHLGGRGQLRMWVDGKLAAELNQRTLFPELEDTYRWVVAVYQTNEAAPINLTRVMKWRRARMMVSP